ncbi:MAG: type I restriction endonuclease subunit R [Phycisphaeraceae bacterium]|nr:type I restriction endonuclease subunit R [Phycisphaeraceae bacterium]
MPAEYKEKAFEVAIEEHLLTNGGFVKADPQNFDRERALDPTVLIPFIQETQGEKWKTLEGLHGANTATVVLDDLCKAMESRGSLDVVRHGFKTFGKQLEVAFFRPAHGMNPDTLKLYQANRLTVTRQLRYSTKSENSIDLVLSLNGIPLVTAELKNPMSGQNVNHARTQYMRDRDPRELIFQTWKRTLVHFAVDPDLVYMTTRLNGKDTFFLPFNLGDGTSAGNPEHSGGHRTFYLWEQVWERDSLLDIIARFIHLEVKERRFQGKTVRKESMIFPRYHQLDCVRRLEGDARAKGPGQNYLVQHSAGSGKSNSIGWLAHRLAFLHNAQDKKVFDSVVVVTDRIVLDQQLQDTIYQFEHKHGVVQKIDENTAQLARALREGVPIIITTLQKFPFVTEQIRKQAEEEAKANGLPAPTADDLTLPGKQFAVIIDEAHSSHSGETATELKAVLAGDHIKQKAKEEAEAQGLDDYEEEVLRTMAKRGRQPNISFFAFTATPKHKTLEVFGTPGSDGKPHPFHLYSMRQAIEEGFILDVLKNYTTYKTYFGLIKSVEEDPNVEKRAAAKALARFMTLHPHNIEQKTEVMVEHFRASTRHKIGGKAKAMVVTGSRLHAVRYKQAFDKYILEKGYKEIATLVAFSGTVIDDLDPNKTYTEGGMNKGIGGREIPERFGTEEYQVLIAADKFQTGFDQPLLHTMYVDKRLAGIQAVQTLSRLNRTHPGKDDTFVLDFYNDREEILKAFQDYYEVTAVGDQANPQQLYALTSELNGAGVYHTDEVEQFAQVFFKPRAQNTPADHGAMNAILDKAVSRFVTMRDELKTQVSEKGWKQAKEEAQEAFRGKLQAFRNLYSFLSQVIPYQDSDLEKLYIYGRFLLTKLPRPATGPQYDFDDDVALKFYRLQKISEGSIALQSGVGGQLKGPTAVGTSRGKDEEIELSRLIDLLNERFGTDFKPADQLFLDSVREDAVANEDLRQAAMANTIDNFSYVFRRALEGLFIDRMEQNEDIFNRFMNDGRFQQVVEETLRRQVYDQIREQAAAESAGVQP